MIDSQSAQRSRSDADFPIAIVGSGFAGLCMAIKLKQAGIDSFTIFERHGELGGTWWANHYPGAACDVPSHLYCFSFEPKPDWSRAFASQPEILDYMRHCADKYDLRRHIRFNTEIAGAEFDEATGLWRVHARNGETVTARAVVMGNGPLSEPALPRIPGIERFRGKSFHSAAWDHGYDLTGKRVAVIGTGASAIQFVPEIAPKVSRLHVFQRTPPWIIKRPDRAYTRFEKWLFRVCPPVQRLHRLMIYCIYEGRAPAFVRATWAMKLLELGARRHLRKGIRDPRLRRTLTPDYVIGCKRVLLSNDYYPALTRPNVELVTDGIAEIREHGIVTRDGRERPVDAIIYGTGFRATQTLSHVRIVGRHGRDINDVWREQGGAQAYLGTTVAGFPNLFLMVGPNTGLGHNSIVYMIEAQVTYLIQCLRMLRDRRLKYLDVRPEVQEDYNLRLQERMKRTVWATGCKSWYLAENGKNVTLWPGFTFSFRRQMRYFDPAKYELCPRERAPGTAAAAAAEA